jgi:hypothetical protein
MKKGLPRPKPAAWRRSTTQCRDGKCELSSTRSEGEVRAIVYVGIDLAKNVFALHGVNSTGAVQLRQPKVGRNKLREVVAALPPCAIGIEARSGTHHWAPLFVVGNALHSLVQDLKLETRPRIPRT